MDAALVVDGGIGAFKGLKGASSYVKNLARGEQTVVEIASESSEIAYSASSSTGKIAVESTEITKESIMRALRQSNTIEGAATAKLIKRNKIDLNIIENTPNNIAKQFSGAKIRGYYSPGAESVNIIKSNLSSVEEAAGITAHETKHWLQYRSGTSIKSKLSEFEAFQWSMKVDGSTYPRTTAQIYELVNTNPVYRNLEPFGWSR